jgi:hypothetical protein
MDDLCDLGRLLILDVVVDLAILPVPIEVRANFSLH